MNRALQSLRDSGINLRIASTIPEDSLHTYVAKVVEVQAALQAGGIARIPSLLSEQLPQSFKQTHYDAMGTEQAFLRNSILPWCYIIINVNLQQCSVQQHATEEMAMQGLRQEPNTWALVPLQELLHLKTKSVEVDL